MKTGVNKICHHITRSKVIEIINVKFCNFMYVTVVTKGSHEYKRAVQHFGPLNFVPPP